jgi:cupin 2 domain-containing protein
MTGEGNIFADLPQNGSHEHVLALVQTGSFRIERIVSHGQASPPGFWYDQDVAEWVIVLAGAAQLLFEGEAGPRTLERGDYLHIPPHVRHRVEWTDPRQPTIWLAVHHG